MNENQSREPCRREGCACTVSSGEEYCGRHCRAADHGELSDTQAEVTACACGHDECAAE